jgi:hypothetical protein
MEELDLPPLILMEDYDNHFGTYFHAVYEVFRADFVMTKPVFRGVRLALKRHPIVDGVEYTFYHFTHTGNDEQNRLPDMRRMERMPFPKPIIEDCDVCGLKVWRNKRKGADRICILCEDERYLVVLDDRGDYILPWTAYYLQYDHELRKKLKEYDEFKKAEAA